jgi:anti-sigma-K factor RskA
MEPAAPSAAKVDDDPRLKRETTLQPPARKNQLIPSSSRALYAFVACLLLFSVYQVWQTHTLNRELAAARETLRAWQWQVSEEAERKALADTRVMPLEAKDPAYGSARLIVTWNSRLYQGVVTMQNLPAVPAGYNYQLWVLDPHEPVPVSAGLLTAANGSQNFTVHPVGTENPGFAVSLEPAGGSPAPTGPILFAVAPIE